MHNRNRDDDERILSWLSLTLAGVSSRVIAQRFGVNSGLVRATIGRVRGADIQESGEPESAVRPAYEWGQA